MTGLLDIDPLSPEALASAARARHRRAAQRRRALSSRTRCSPARAVAASARATPRRRTPRRSSGAIAARRGTAAGPTRCRAPRRRPSRARASTVEPVGREPHEPFAVAVGAVEVDRLAGAGQRDRRRGQNGIRSKNSSIPSTASSCSIGSAAPAARLRVPAVHRGLVRLAPRPEPGACDRSSTTTPSSSGPTARERVGERGRRRRRTSRSRSAGPAARPPTSASDGSRRASATIARRPSGGSARRARADRRPVHSGHDGTARVDARVARGGRERVRLRGGSRATYSRVLHQSATLPATRSSSSGPLLSALFTSVETGHVSSSSAGAGTSSLLQRVDVVVLDDRATCPTPTPGSTTGMRS